MLRSWVRSPSSPPADHASGRFSLPLFIFPPQRAFFRRNDTSACSKSASEQSEHLSKRYFLPVISNHTHHIPVPYIQSCATTSIRRTKDASDTRTKEAPMPRSLFGSSAHTVNAATHDSLLWAHASSPCVSCFAAFFLNFCTDLLRNFSHRHSRPYSTLI